MRFNEYLSSHFRSCRLLAEGHDPHRGRDVTLHQIPGTFDVVGVFDGVDAWVAPVLINPFGANVQALLRRIQDGEQVAPVLRARTADQQKRQRVRLLPDTTTTTTQGRVRVKLL